MKEINIGACVKLKSGGPAMTVTENFESKRGFSTINCIWFTPSGESKFESFDVRCIEVVDPE